jgi:hypothetical protein
MLFMSHIYASHAYAAICSCMPQRNLFISLQTALLQFHKRIKLLQPTLTKDFF